MEHHNQEKIQVIRLSEQGHFYQQYTYQFAHELTHLFTNWEDLQNRKFTWLLETFAEMGSAYTMIMFAEKSPLPSFPDEAWIQYFNSQYGSNYGGTLEHLLEPGQQVEDWYPQYKVLLQNFGTVRELNWAFSQELLPHFMIDESMWMQLAEMNKWDNARDKNMQDYLTSWRKRLLRKKLNTSLITLLEKKIPAAHRR